jgi:hypothetical protein
MKTKLTVLVAGLIFPFFAAAADPRTNCWLTTYAGQYARIYTNDAMKTAGNTLSNWSNGSLTQTNPAYCGVQEVYSSTNWVYVRSTGLGSYVMGPWYLNAQRTAMFPNFPVNQRSLFRFPRTNGVPVTKSITGGGQIGIFVDGVAMFNSWDAFYWNGTTETGSGGSGYWNRDAYVNEGVTLDPGYAHQQNTGTYHYHADPIALRYQVGDHVDYNPATKTYSESTNVATKHSPILAWTADGYPLYGPYGYSNATNTGSGIRRMVSGYVVRNGQYGTSNLTANGRTTIPAWAARIFGVASNIIAGPNVSTTYPLGRYMEDNDYLGDHGYTQGVDFDLDEYNGRYCVTPEFPGGTYAYFVAIASNGIPLFPYNIGRAFRGDPVGGSVSIIGDTVVTNFLGSTNLTSTLNAPAVKNGTVTLTWNALEGGQYQVEATTNLSSGWTVVATGVLPNQVTGAYTNAAAPAQRFYRAGRTSVSTYDSAGTTVVATPAVAPGGSASRGQTVYLTITLPSSPPNPPTLSVPTSVTLAGTINGTSISHPTTNTVTALFVIPANASTGAQNVVVTFSPNPAYTLTGGFTINP